jgi:hypothetical protein
LPDYLVDVATRTKPSPFTRDHEDGDVVAMLDFSEQIAKIRVDVERESVETLGAGKGHTTNSVFDPKLEVFPILGKRCGRSVWAHRWQANGGTTRWRSPPRRNR